MSTKQYGEKYDRELRGAQISAAIRRDIKEAVSAGELPDAKYSVKLQTFSGGKSISIRVSDLPFPLFDRRFLQHELETKGHVFYGGERYSVERRELLEKLERIGNAYNFDRSDIQTDYFHVNYYLHVAIDSSYEAAQRRAEMQAVLDEIATKRATREEELENTDPVWLSMSRRQASSVPSFGLPRQRNDDAESADVAPWLWVASAIAAPVIAGWWRARRPRRVA